MALSYVKVVKEPNFGKDTTLMRCCIAGIFSVALTFLWIFGMKYVRIDITVNR